MDNSKTMMVGSKRLEEGVGFKRLEEGVVVPSKKHFTDSGFDLRASRDVFVGPGQSVQVPTGIAVELPEGTEAQVRPRSGITSKTPIRVQLGTVDNDYTGEILIMVDNIMQVNKYGHLPYNLETDSYKTLKNEELPVFEDTVPENTYVIRRGEKIAQLVVQYLPQTVGIEIEGDIKETERGSKGFGHSGV